MINLIHPRKDFLVVNNLAKWHQLLICTAINCTAIKLNWTGKISNSKKYERKKLWTHLPFLSTFFPSKYLPIRYVYSSKTYPLFSSKNKQSSSARHGYKQKLAEFFLVASQNQSSSCLLIALERTTEKLLVVSMKKLSSSWLQ